MQGQSHAYCQACGEGDLARGVGEVADRLVACHQVEVVVDNTLIQQEMENFKGRIIKTLINSLHNEGLTLEIKVAELKNRVRLLTRREQFEALSKENPAVEKLRQEFDLELA